MASFNVLNLPVTKIRSEVLVLGVFRDLRPLNGLAGDVDWIHQGLISKLLLNGKISGKFGETTLLATQRKLLTPKVLIQGLGTSRAFNAACVHSANLASLAAVRRLGARHCVLELFGLNQSPIGVREYVDILIDLTKTGANDLDLDLSLLVSDEDKAHQVRQQLIERSVMA